MEADFEIIDNCAIGQEGRHIDLHNNFDFMGMDCDWDSRTIQLNWKKSSGGWVAKDEVSNLAMTHLEVTYLNIEGQDDQGNLEDALCLMELGYFPSSERETKDSFTTQSKPKEDDDILYFFENGQRICIHCARIELRVNEQPNRRTS
jgi:hypothetical protein